MADQYYSLGDALNNIDFYIGGVEASSTQSISLDATISANKIAYASSSLSASLTTASTSSIAIRNISSTISGIFNITAAVVEINPLSINSLNITSSFIASIIKFAPNYIDSSLIRTHLLIDNQAITNHNRNLDISRTPMYVENRNWNNTLNRYYKRQTNSDKATFSLSWSFIPGPRTKTVDNLQGRDYLASLSEDPDVHVLKIINQDESGTTPYTETSYNVFIRSYSESLIRRDIPDGAYYFNCNLVLEEA